MAVYLKRAALSTRSVIAYEYLWLPIKRIVISGPYQPIVMHSHELYKHWLRHMQVIHNIHETQYALILNKINTSSLFQFGYITFNKRSKPKIAHFDQWILFLHPSQRALAWFFLLIQYLAQIQSQIRFLLKCPYALLV